VTEGGNAFFSVKPSAAVKSGSWIFKGKAVVQWIGETFGVPNDYTGRVELFFPNGSLLLKSVTDSDSGDYTVTMSSVSGSETTATISLHVLGK